MRKLRVGIVVGELSGDILGASLIQSLKQLYPDLVFEGIAGPKMLAEGCQSFYPMDRLSMMGFFEPLKRLPELIKMRNFLINYFIKNRPDVFVGIDAPDFNLGIEEKLKKSGIKTVHYVSPSVWAWRQSRIKKIKRAVNLMLTLFPFETNFYQKHQVPVKFVGHPLADQIPFQVNTNLFREKLGLFKDKKILAIMPGSRCMELNYLADKFIQTAKWCLDREPDLQIITSMVNEERRRQFAAILQAIEPTLPISIFVNQSQDVMAASDVLLLASGTITLEAMLLKKPMVVAYRMSSITYFLMKHLVKLDYFSLPNLIANKKLIPEFLQNQVEAENLGVALLNQLNNQKHRIAIIDEFKMLHQLLQKDASIQAAKSILELVNVGVR